MVKIATILGEAEDEKQYTALACSLGRAYANEYATFVSRLADNTQTAFSLALVFDLFPSESHRDRAAEDLQQIIRRNARFKIATGFVGTPSVGHALSEAGMNDTLYRMLLSTSCPSWLYPVNMGATTIWERWDSMLFDGSADPGEMTSFDHYALGAVAD